jgi:hypothetical protein
LYIPSLYLAEATQSPWPVRATLRIGPWWPSSTVSEKVEVFTTCTDRRMWLLVMALEIMSVRSSPTLRATLALLVTHQEVLTVVIVQAWGEDDTLGQGTIQEFKEHNKGHFSFIGFY